jgi:glycosyltransferase involved in cell wall biosynthesis
MSQLLSAGGTVSIVIPCYNHGAVLREALASIEQVRNDNLCEVIIVNDGSTDTETCQLLKELAGSKYTILNQSNRGLGAARNAGVAAARGKFILPLDSDNRIRKPYLTEGVRLLQQNPKLGVVYGDAENFGEKTGREHVPDFNLLYLIRGNYIDACALYRKAVWDSVQGYDEKMPWMGYEDWDFWRRVALQGWQFHHLKEIAFDYRVSGGSMLRSQTNLHQEELKAYIAGKRESDVLQSILNSEMELARLNAIEESGEYRLGRMLLGPIQRVKKLFFK